MTVISFFPVFNWLAWVFAAFDDPARASLYYTYTALYLLPLLRNGFQIDSPTIAWLVLGILHVQVERIARTEAVQISLPGGVQPPPLGEPAQLPEPDEKAFFPWPQREEKTTEQLELEEFDRQLRKRPDLTPEQRETAIFDWQLQGRDRERLKQRDP
eukprot:jgi/Botrbrau1/5782/Bobra.0155s0005.1